MEATLILETLDGFTKDSLENNKVDEVYICDSIFGRELEDTKEAREDAIMIIKIMVPNAKVEIRQVIAYRLIRRH